MTADTETTSEQEREASDPLTPPDRLCALVSAMNSASTTREYKVFLDTPGPNPVSVTRLLKDHGEIGLKEAFDRMRAWPGCVYCSHERDDALALLEGLRAIRAEAHLQEATGAQAHRLALLVASNPAAPPDLLEHLASQGSAEIREAVAANPSTARRLLFALGSSFPRAFLHNPQFALLLLEDPSLEQLPGELFSRLLDVPESLRWLLPVALERPGTRLWLAEKRLQALSPELVAALAKDDDLDVRCAVAGGLAGRTEGERQMLARMLADEEEDVRRYASCNPATPQDLLALLRRAGTSEDLEGLSLPQDPTLTPAELETIARAGPFGRALAVRHPAAPSALLHEISGFAESYLFCDLLAHPNVTGETISKIAKNALQSGDMSAQQAALEAVAAHARTPLSLLDELTASNPNALARLRVNEDGSASTTTPR